jgi:O-antigen ligase
MRNFLLSALPGRLQQYHSGWMQAAVVIVILLLSAALPVRFSSRLIMMAMALIAGIGVILILLRHPPLGLAAIIVGGLLLPIDISVSAGSKFNAAMLITLLMTVLWLADMIIRRRRIDLVPSRPLIPLFAFLAVAVLAFVVGQRSWFLFASTAPITAQIGGLILFFLAACALLLSAHLIRDLRWLQALTWLFVGLGSLFIISQLIPPLKRPLSRLFQYGATSSLFWTWLIALSLSQALFNRRLPLGARLALGLFAAPILYVSYTLVPGWKSGWVPALATAGVLLALRFPPLIVAGGVGGIAAAPTALSYLIASDEYSYSTRLEAWNLILEIVKANPLLGLGPANYHWYTPLFPIRGYAVRFNSHNQYVDLLAQTGLIGLGCFLWFAWEIGRLGWRLRQTASEGFARAYANGAFAGLVGTLVAGVLGDWILPFVYNIGFVGFRGSVLAWLFLGGLIALEQMRTR